MTDRQPLERFYSLKEVADRIGKPWKELTQEVRDGVYEVDTYRWASGPGSRIFVSQTHANMIMGDHDAPLFDDPPPETKPRYGLVDVANILGLTKTSVFNLATGDRLVNANTIPMEEHDDTKFSKRKLTEWFGKNVMVSSGLDAIDRRAFAIDEVSEALRISQKRLRSLVASGALEPLKTSHLTVRYTISHNALAEWIESRKGAFDEDKSRAVPREKEAVS